jgi:predicted nuclease of predicted toxin-antitoxin system
VKFLVDAQLPPAVARWLRDAGHDAQAVREVGLREAEDDEIWRHALATGAVIITKDEDFPIRAQQTDTSPVVVWLRIGNTSNHALRLWLIPQLPQLLAWIEQGVRVLEIR